MPCYGNLFYVRTAYFEFARDEAAHELFWDEYRRLLSQEDDRLAGPLAYTLNRLELRSRLTKQRDDAAEAPGLLDRQQTRTYVL